jgi:ribokinase
VEGKTDHAGPAAGVRAVDTSGAGDAFVGSLAVFLGRSMTLADAAARASLVAALSVTRMGTQAAFPSRLEVEGFLQQKGYLEAVARTRTP